MGPAACLRATRIWGRYSPAKSTERSSVGSWFSDWISNWTFNRYQYKRRSCRESTGNGTNTVGPKMADFSVQVCPDVKGSLPAELFSTLAIEQVTNAWIDWLEFLALKMDAAQNWWKMVNMLFCVRFFVGKIHSSCCSKLFAWNPRNNLPDGWVSASAVLQNFPFGGPTDKNSPQIHPVKLGCPNVSFYHLII